MMATYSPRSMSRDTPRSAWISSEPMTYVLQRSRVSIKAIVRRRVVQGAPVRGAYPVYGPRAPAVSGRLQAGQQRLDDRRGIGRHVRVPRAGVDRHHEQLRRRRPALRFLDRGRELGGGRDGRPHQENDARVALAVLRDARRHCPRFAERLPVHLRHEPAEHARRQLEAPERGFRNARHLEARERELLPASEFTSQHGTEPHDGGALDEIICARPILLEDRAAARRLRFRRGTRRRLRGRWRRGRRWRSSRGPGLRGRLSLLLRVVFRARGRIGQRLVRARQLRGLGRGNLLELLAEVLNLVGVILGDFAPEGALDVVRRRVGRDVERLVDPFGHERRCLLLDLGDVGGGRQLAHLALLAQLLRALARRCRLRALRAVRTELPSGLQRTMAVRAPAADAVAARRARGEVGRDAGAAFGAGRARFAHFRDDSQQLVRRGHAGFHLQQAVFAERDHAGADRRVPQLRFRSLLRDHASQLVGDRHDFVDADAAAVARVIALLAADGAIERQRGRLLLGHAHRAERLRVGRVRAAAVHAEAAHQALRDDADERRRADVRLDADVGQSGHARRRIVGVERREHEVARLRRLHGDARGLLVADLADEHDVRVLPEDRPQGAGERQLDLVVDLGLVDAGNLVLDGILDGDDVGPLRAHRRQRRAERRRLARTCRADDQDHPVLVFQEEPNRLERGCREAEILQRRHALAVVEDAEDDLFAEDRPERRRAEVDLLAVVGGNADAAVLREALLRDVHAAHDLHARDEPFVDPLRQVHHFLQQPVEAVPDDDVVLGGLDVDVARAALERALDDEIDQVDDRRRLGRRALERGLLEHVVLDAARGEAGVFGNRREHPAGRRRLAGVSRRSRGHLDRDAGTGLVQARQRLVGIRRVDRVDDLLPRRDDLLDAVAGLELEVLDEREEQRIRHRDRQQVLLDADGDAGALERNVLWYQNDGSRIGYVLREIDVGETELIGEGLRNLALSGQDHADEDRPKPLP